MEMSENIIITLKKKGAMKSFELPRHFKTRVYRMKAFELQKHFKTRV